ncbi:GNAT family N-acetyltransferase [Cupriavidus metallidurans]|uniref:GNAT family N-acetyltransferase n=1 Tax=Cupriavidus metallidurans TaxID=119219 RepID=UPI001644C184|nr:GNAT family N-acetyltransferase [Cupriavidus metallidurans]
MTRIAIVNPAECIPAIGGLLADNWAETGFDFPFAPDVATYGRLFDAGMCFAVAALDGDAVIGYCTVVITPHAHNPAVIVAANDALFIAPEYRNGLAAGRVLKAAEAEAKRRGAARMLWHCRAGTDLAEMLMRHGYAPADIVVMKEL